MGFFSKILGKLGIGTDSAAATPATPATPATTATTATTAAATTTAAASPGAAPAAPPSSKPVAQVDVVAQLEQRAAANTQKLNWRASIVDLLKLLDIDSSLAARKELAIELGCPADLMEDSAQMNMWLHKSVLARIAANGGNVPQNLLD